MKLAAHRDNAAIPKGATVLAAVLVSALLAGPIAAQQTLVIGDDKPSPNASGPKRPDTDGVVINNSVLDSLGSPGAFAPAQAAPTPFALPAQAGAPLGSPLGAPGLATTGAPGTAYRLPGTGQLVISRPSTLLFPPSTFPKSRLTVPAPAGHPARAATAPRLAQPAPATPPGPAPTVATAVPREPVIEAPEPVPPIAPIAEPTPPPAAPIAPTAEPIAPTAPPAAVAALPPEPEPVAEPPSASSMTEELQSPPPAEPSPPAAPAPVEAAPKPEAKPEPSQSAALSPPSDPVSEKRLVFDDGSAELTAAATGQLDGVAKELLSNESARVQLLAYAKASAEGSSRARRLSLSRALAVRAYLIEQGIRSTRMDVRALGSGFENGPPDRVDILPQNAGQ